MKHVCTIGDKNEMFVLVDYDYDYESVYLSCGRISEPNAVAFTSYI